MNDVEKVVSYDKDTGYVTVEVEVEDGLARYRRPIRESEKDIFGHEFTIGD